MGKIEKNKKYESQALAITMVVLVVSALIGLSIYSKSMKDKTLTLDERASAEALEVSDLALERLILLPIEDVVDAIVETSNEMGANLEDGIVLTENENTDEVTELLGKLGVIGDTSKFSDLLSPLCPSDQAANEYQLTLKIADENTFYEVRPGHIWSLPVKNILEGKSDCGLDMKFAIRGDSNAGFALIKIYCEYDEDTGIATNCEEYVINNTDKYCFSNGLTCNNENFLDDDNWYKFNPDEDDFGEIMMSGGSAPSEIRVTAVGGTIGISYSLPEDCFEGLHMYQLKATANCSGVYRGKEILIPEKKWHESIFDYVIFNNEGSVQ